MSSIWMISVMMTMHFRLPLWSAGCRMVFNLRMIPINPYKISTWTATVTQATWYHDIILLTSEIIPGPVEIPGFGCWSVDHVPRDWLASLASPHQRRSWHGSTWKTCPQPLPQWHRATSKVPGGLHFPLFGQKFHGESASFIHRVGCEVKNESI